jgi:hypothetical protein
MTVDGAFACQRRARPRRAGLWRASALVWAVVLAASANSTPARAQIDERQVRVFYYEQLRRSPWRALAYEGLLPGAGSAYTALFGNAIFTASLSLLGAGLWTYGALADDRNMWWIGAGTFTLGRTYGLVSAPLGAGLLNRAYRKQLRLGRLGPHKPRPFAASL